VRLLTLVLALAASQGAVPPTPAPEMRVEAVVLGRTPTPGRAVLDLAFLSEVHVVALTPQEILLYRWTDQGLAPVASRVLPGRAEAVRWPGGLLNVVEEDRAVWALASTRDQAVLFTLQSGRLAEGEQAAALPWPRCRSGLRYRPGTNLLEGEVDGLGPGPFLTLDAVAAAAVAPDGRLLVAGTGPGAVRVGPTLGPLWSRHLAASSAAPPGEDDALLVLAREGGTLRRVGHVALGGPVRALATRPRDGRARVVAAVTEAAGETRLVALELSPLGP
jgi:hypothetical protein